MFEGDIMTDVFSQEDILDIVEQQLYLAIINQITVKQLDSNISQTFNVAPVFDGGSNELLALKDCQLLCYYLSTVADNQFYKNCVLLVKFRFDLESSQNIKEDLSSVIIRDELLSCDILDLDNQEDKKTFESYKQYAMMLSDDFQEEIIKDTYKNNDIAKRDMIQNLENNGIF